MESFQTKLLYFITASLLIVYVDCSCGVHGMPGSSPGETQDDTCDYYGWIISANSSFKSPAPYCEECTCYGYGAYSCCGYGWRGGPVGVEGCKRVIDLSTCDHVFVDSSDESQPCESVSRIPA